MLRLVLKNHQKEGKKRKKGQRGKKKEENETQILPVLVHEKKFNYQTQTSLVQSFDSTEQSSDVRELNSVPFFFPTTSQKPKNVKRTFRVYEMTTTCKQ